MIDSALGDRLAEALGARVSSVAPLAGGDINEAYRIELADGRRLFMKTNRRAPADMFEAEAEGLRWLAEAGALRVPEVVAVAAEFLVLEHLEAAEPVADFEERVGRGLAALHRAGSDGFGLHRDNFIGRLAQVNTRESDWAEFYRSHRLQPQLRMARDAGLVSPACAGAFERLLVRMESFVGVDEPPARLHGDLWGGNLHRDEAGSPVLIDPAVYGGHREVDLAMMRLFGGFSPRCFAAYAEAWPLSAGHEERVALYQLYPLLVHVNLFGGGYSASVERALSRLV